MSELTPHELELLAESGEFRGYMPRDDVPEPTEGPPGPAGASAPPAERRRLESDDRTPPPLGG